MPVFDLIFKNLFFYKSKEKKIIKTTVEFHLNIQNLVVWKKEKYFR